MIATEAIARQLTDIYFNYENWHKTRMDYGQALRYHIASYERGNIYAYLKEDEIIGYYERYMVGNTCFLTNVFIMPKYRKGEVFKKLYRHFFDTMPSNITEIFGEQQKLKGKVITRYISKGRRNGQHKD